MLKLWFVVSSLFLVFFLQIADADQLTLGPSQDTAIYSESGELANGDGQHLFSGTISRNDMAVRRALVAFDIATSVPAGSTITNVSLSMTVDRSPGGAIDNDFRIHRLTQAWLEGDADAPGSEGRGVSLAPEESDTTWASTGNGGWQNAGGDFVEVASSVVKIGAAGDYSWPTSSMLVNDVQSWLDAPDSNFGWIVIGDESVQGTARRFASAQNSDMEARPTLSIDFTLPGLLGDFDEDGELFANDIDLLCESVRGGLHPPERDLNGDSLVDLADLTVWLEELKGTHAGDVDLDGFVNFTDFLFLSSSFGVAPPFESGRWMAGDFDCDGTTGFPDFLLLAQNFNVRHDEALANAPEPRGSRFWLLCLMCCWRQAGFPRRKHASDSRTTGL